MTTDGSISTVTGVAAVDGSLAVILLVLRLRDESAPGGTTSINPLAAEKLWVWVIAGLLLWSVVLVFTRHFG